MRGCLLAPFNALFGGGAAPPNALPANLLDPASWTIGPVIDGHNYSSGVPLHPLAAPVGFAIDLPLMPGSVHYVTAPCGALAGMARIVLGYRLDLADGVAVKPISDPRLPSAISLYFQRRGDDWSGTGQYEAYRWYASGQTQAPIVAGEHRMVAALGEAWTAVETSNSLVAGAAFAAALADAGQVGFVLGGGTGLGHGVFATGPARLTVTDFRVE